MATIHPDAVEHHRKRWLRHDAYRFAAPGTPEADPGLMHPWAEVARQEQAAADEAKAREAAEQEALAREVEALRASHQRVRIMLADLKFELALRALGRKYSEDQPRVPAGSREGGQWTDGGGTTAEVSVVDPRSDAAGLVMSDATPDGVRAWAQYAEAADQKNRDAATIARTTAVLHGVVLQVSGTVVRRADVSPREYGTEVHYAFANAVRALNLPGVGRVGVEQSFDRDGEARYGQDGSIRTDIILRNEEQQIIAIYDLKTGNAIIRPPRASELRMMTGAGSDVPVIELHSTRGPARR
jgi:hypothetical protein